MTETRWTHAPEKPLYYKGLTSLSLLFYYCKDCGELCIEGFPDQLEIVRVDRVRRLAWSSSVCRSCGAEHHRRIELTTGSGRKRLFRWSWMLLPAFWQSPTWLHGLIFRLFCFLERRVAI